MSVCSATSKRGSEAEFATGEGQLLVTSRPSIIQRTLELVSED